MVSRAARQLGAAAFSRGGEVYLPTTAGRLSQAPARALVAHELTHVVQQRALGGALPAEDSPDGRELERQAVATQRLSMGVAELAREGSGIGKAAGARGVQRQIASTATPDSAFPSDGALQPGTVALDSGVPSAQRPGHMSWPGPTGAARAAGPATEPTGRPGPGGAVTGDVRAGIAELRERVAALAMRPDLDDPAELDRLATRLYRRLRSRLRLELIVDRERSGLLTDFR